MQTDCQRIPVILDTDIGDDIDDTWALAMLLGCPELDLKLVVSDTGDAEYRAGILAKFLTVAGHTEIPVGLGPSRSDKCRFHQSKWIDDYDIASYPGTVYEDGIGAMIDVIMQSPVPVTLICIGPVPNIADALAREPAIVRNARFVGMHGSVRKGYGGSEQIAAEANVKNGPAVCRVTLEADWLDTLITPLDTCGLVSLSGEQYARVRNKASSPALDALFENYRIWLETTKQPTEYLQQKSSILFDTVAVYLAFAEDLLEIEELGTRVTDEGFTLIDESGPRIRVATQWRDLDAFRELLVDRLCSI